VFLADVDSLYNDAVFVRQDFDDLTTLAFIFQSTADNFYRITFANLHSHCTRS
jgi:hypothetical protein